MKPFHFIISLALLPCLLPLAQADDSVHRKAAQYNFEKGKPLPLLLDDFTVLMVETAVSVASGVSDWFESRTEKNLYSTWKGENQRAEWIVRSDKEQRCRVRLLADNLDSWDLTVGGNTLKASHPARGFERADVGEVVLPQGDCRIALNRTAAGPAKFKSVEIIPVDVLAEMDRRAAALRSSTDWIRQAKYGVMVQFGAWGYPPHGDKLPWPKLFEQFDVESFAKMVDEDMGAGWVIWSLTWRGSRFSLPLQSVDALVADHTTQDDFIGKLADALSKRGVKLMFYYHPGHEDKEFWQANVSGAGRADRSRFFENWQSIMNEIGIRYGSRLAGWFFDDGCVYYPAPFEMLTRAAKAGYPQRLVSYNNWALPLYTEFQDIQMGEGARGGNVKIEDLGIYKSGPLAGQQAHGMFCIDGPDWGIWKPETKITPAIAAPQVITAIKEGIRRGMPLSLNFLMYEDGSVSPATMETMRAVKAAIRSGEKVAKE